MKASKPSQTKKTAHVDTRWLQDYLRSKGLNQAKVAKALKVNPAAISLLFAGKRGLKTSEINPLARALDMPPDEVLGRFGAAMEEVPAGGRFVKVEGQVSGELRVKFTRSEKGTVICPFPDRDLKVVRVMTAGSEYDGLDGALIYFKTTELPAAEGIGRVVLVKLVDQKEMRFGVLKRGYGGAGKYNLYALSGKVLESDFQVEYICSIVWLKI